MRSHQDKGDFTISADGSQLSQDSQSWEHIAGSFVIEADTRLQFDFSSQIEGEVHGIMFINDNGTDAEPLSTHVRNAGLGP